MSNGISEQVENLLPSGGIKFSVNDYYATREAPAFDVEGTLKESPSSILKYLGCPLSWWAERYAKDVFPPDRGSFHSILGTFVHRNLEVFYQEPAGGRSEKLLNDLFRHSWDIFRGAKENDGAVDEGNLREFRELLEKDRNPAGMKRNFFTRSEECINAILDFEDPDEVEVVSTEQWLKRSKNGIMVRGLADRIVSGANGEIIDDYKTGRVPEYTEASVLYPTFVPIGIYCWSRAQEAGGEVGMARLLYLWKLRRINIKSTNESIRATDHLLDRVTTDMMDFWSAEDRVITATPARRSSDTPCRFCPLVKMCPAWTDGSELRAKLQG